MYDSVYKIFSKNIKERMMQFHILAVNTITVKKNIKSFKKLMSKFFIVFQNSILPIVLKPVLAYFLDI